MLPALARALAEDADRSVREVAATALSQATAQGYQQVTAAPTNALAEDTAREVRWRAVEALHQLAAAETEARDLDE